MAADESFECVCALGREPIQLIDFDDIFAPDLSRWRTIVMAKNLFWLSDEAWKALNPA
jgi:hypothetical protein